MKLFTFAIAITITLASSQDVQFDGDAEVPVSVDTRADGISEEDVNTRIFGNIDLNSFVGNVAASALGTVVGNTGTNLASNYLSGCSNRGKRSVLMHKLEKRQAIEAAEKSGNANADPEVQTRLFCPQDFLSGGGSAGNNGRFCDRCSCRDYDCNRDCRKCVINNNNGYPSGWSSNSGNSGSSGSSWSSNSNTGWSSNSGNYNRPTTSNSINCNSCSCSSSSSCRRYCTSRCQNNNNYYPSSSGSSWNNGGSYNTGWRVAGRTNEDSEATEEVASDTKFEQKLENVEEAVVFA